MSLRDANNKMSKSDISKYSRILLTDSNDDITNKINKAKSDSQNMPTSLDELENRPEINNLITIYSCVINKDKQTIVELFSGKEISSFKKELKDVVINLIEPLAKKIKKIRDDKAFLISTLNEGAQSAQARASKTISEINNLMGLSFE